MEKDEKGIKEVPTHKLQARSFSHDSKLQAKRPKCGGIYTIEFDNLMLKGELVKPEEQTIARFLGGLKNKIARVVQLQPC